MSTVVSPMSAVIVGTDGQEMPIEPTKEELKAKILHLESAMNTLKEDHVKEMADKQAAHEQQMAEDMQKLNDRHAKEMADKQAAHEREMADSRARHEREMARLQTSLGQDVSDVSTMNRSRASSASGSAASPSHVRAPSREPAMRRLAYAAANGSGKKTEFDEDMQILRNDKARLAREIADKNAEIKTIDEKIANAATARQNASAAAREQTKASNQLALAAKREENKKATELKRKQEKAEKLEREAKRLRDETTGA